MRESDMDPKGGAVFLSDDLPMEAPAKEYIAGPYYKNIEEVVPDLGERASDGGNDEGSDLGLDRRNFMRLFSISALTASASCVRRPVEKVVPYVDQPIDHVPGVDQNYATVDDSGTGCGLVVKTREGRPVKIKGNPDHPLSQGGSTALVEASLQSLYHPDRPKNPRMRWGKEKISEVSWDEVYEELAEVLKKTNKVGILTRGYTGHRGEFFREFLKKLGAPEANIFTYDSQTLYASISKAHEIAFGVGGLPRPDLRSTDFIVGIGAEFLDVGVSTVYESKGWVAGHGYRHGRMGKFVQFESRMTCTGSKAAERHVIAPGDELAVTLGLVEALLANSSVRGTKKEQEQIQAVVDGQKQFIAQTLSRLGIAKTVFTELAAELLDSNRLNKSLVIVGQSGANDENGTLVQLAGIMANKLIGAYEKALNFKRGWMNSPVQAGDVSRFLKDGKDLDVLIIVDCNPAFTLPKSSGIHEVLEGIGEVVSIQAMPTETDAYARFVLNGHHFLESWGDEENVAGFWSTRQPVVRPLTNSKQAEDIMLWVLAKMDKPLPYREYRDFLLKKWERIYKLTGVKVGFPTFFNAVLRRGFVGKLSSRTVSNMGPLASYFSQIKAPQQGLKFVAHLDNRLKDGIGADRPVLQEVGDSLTTIAWDTWVGISPLTAKKMGLKYNDLVEIKGAGGVVEAAVFPFPGLHADCVVMPRGNGRAKGLSRVTDGVGVDPQIALGSGIDPLSGCVVTSGQTVSLRSTGKKYRLAAMQKHNDIANRSDIVKVMNLTTARKNAGKKKKLDDAPDLYPELKQGQYRWGLSIDLDKCSGCSACMVSCALENNVPQVGREQILLGREMHWIRTDRYFSGPVENPTVTFQPVMCQHCNHAPCEAVCPVYATTHDPEGMNVQTYNRCVGTRYCANACPYKVRRFNWWTHKWNVSGDRPVDRNPRPLNPDVTVRTRGIMEKCSFCYQRVRDAKHNAKERKAPNNKVKDREIKTACEEACPTNAIVFGDLNDQTSRVAQMRTDNRAYLMLGGDPDHGHYGLKTFPNVNYLAKVEHDKSGGGDDDHSHG